MHLDRQAALARPPGFVYAACVNGQEYRSDRLQTLVEAMGITPRISPVAVSLFFTLGFVPAPYCIYEHVTKIAPDAGQDDPEDSFRDSCAEASFQLETLLAGALVSGLNPRTGCRVLCGGGLDSSLVQALLSEVRGGPVPTCAIDSAAAGLAGLGFRSAADLLPLFGELEEPVADTMLIPLAAAFRAMAPCDVAVTGLAADDAFGGLYEHAAIALTADHSATPESWSMKDQAVINRMRARLAIDAGGIEGWSAMLSRFSHADRQALIGTYLRDHGATDGADLFLRTWIRQQPSVLTGAMRFARQVRLPHQTAAVIEAASRWSRTTHFSPFLAGPVLAFASRLPPKLLADGVRRKPLLLAIARRRLSPEVWARPKTGFSLPTSVLHPLVHEVLSSGEDDIVNRSAMARVRREAECPDTAERALGISRSWMIAAWRLWRATHPVGA